MQPDLSNLWAQCQADTPGRRAKLYGLALLRSIFPQTVVAQVLGTTRSQGRYRQRFGFLYEDYTIIFTDDSHQSLRPEVRTFLRRQLLAQRRHAEIMGIITTILQNQQARMKTVETTPYPNLQSRLRDGAWSLTFLDLLEARLWFDPTTAIYVAIPSLLAASLYHPDHVRTIYELVLFFEDQIDEPQREWWVQACQAFNIREHVLPPGRLAECLHEVRNLLIDGKLPLTEPFTIYRQQLVAALWWQEGEVFRDVNLYGALEYYHKALCLLYPEKDISMQAARLYRVLADMFSDPLVKITLLEDVVGYDPDCFNAYAELGSLYFEQKEYKQALKYYHYAVELEHHHVELWVNLGVIHTFCKDYQRALDELNHAILLDSTHFLPYYNRANVYLGLKQYQEALADYNTTLVLDHTYASAYINRGNVYAMLNRPEQARQDYEEALRLQPSDLQALWLHEWINFGKQRIDRLEAQRLQAIAEQDSNDYLNQVCRGIFTAVTHRNLKSASEALERAWRQEPDQWDPPFWLAMLYAYRNRPEQAIAALQQAITLGLPVALLQPLYWLETDRPDFFQRHALPVLQQYSLS